MSVANAVRQSLQAIKTGAHLNAFTAVQSEQKLLAEAANASSRISGGDVLSAIDGKIIGVKDNIVTTDLPTSCSSEMLRDYTSPFEATVVKRLREAGGIIVGKTNMDEFGMGSHSTYSIHGAVKNPAYDGEEKSAGGSSGGSAAAVKAGMCDVALGTDTGGSVRLPASYCGVVGFKPSYGLISRWGVVAYANSLDTVGILGNKCDEVKNVFEVISAYDENDPTSITDETRERTSGLLRKYRQPGPLRIGLPMEYNVAELSPVVRSAWQRTLAHLASLGHEILPVTLPRTPQALSAYYVLAPAEASSNLARYDGLRYGFRAEQDRSEKESILFAPTRSQGFGDEVRRRILLGAYTLSAGAMDNYFLKAQSVRRLIQQDFDAVFRLKNPLREGSNSLNQAGVDAIIAPTALGTAPSLEEVRNTERAVDGYTNDVLTVPASLAGVPSISLPVETEEGSVGMQVIAQWGDEDMIWRVSSEIERMG